ncbi:amino acid racemase [Candidatus Microgenomates bacterium]|nr:MAG: amino acid racemase [Candidatus Microgenomates bacterium]
MKKQKTIYVLGGMGPQASGYLYKLLVEKAVNNFGAEKNEDYPEIIIHSIPVPDFISDNSKRKQALRMLKKRVEKLNSLDISCLSIACNTAHILLPRLENITKLKFVSIITETVKEVHKRKKKKVGLLGTPSTIKYGLYQSELKKYGIEPVVLDSNKDLQIIEKIIRNVLKGKILAKDEGILEKAANKLKARGAEGIILGCTELPLVFPKKCSLPVFNSLEILAMALLRNYYK